MSSFVLHRNASNRSQILANCVSFLSQLPDDKPWQVSITPYRKERSSPQNRYLHGVVYKTLSDALGFDSSDVAEYLLGTYYGWNERALPGGRRESKPMRTTTTDENGDRKVLSKAEFADYVDFCLRYGAEHGIYIPSPEQEFDE